MPMLFTAVGQQHLEFIPISQITESMNKGGQPVRLGEMLSALGDSTQAINKLQEENARLRAENDKLWKVAMNGAPKPQPPPNVVVQQTAPPEPSPLERYMLLRSLWAPTQPYQLPMPVNPNASRIQTNCTTSAIGNTTYTNCN
jgi:hypothetical protein